MFWGFRGNLRKSLLVFSIMVDLIDFVVCIQERAFDRMADKRIATITLHCIYNYLHKEKYEMLISFKFTMSL